MTSVWPAKDIDHIDTNPENNAWNNLRYTTDSQNLGNRGKQSNNTSGYKGVYWQKIVGKWCAEIVCDGKKFRLGYAPTAREAHQLYVAAANELFGEFARHA